MRVLRNPELLESRKWELWEIFKILGLPLEIPVGHEPMGKGQTDRHKLCETAALLNASTLVAGHTLGDFNFRLDSSFRLKFRPKPNVRF